MVDRTEALVLQMSADITRMTKALNQARGQTDRQLSAVEKRFDRMNAHIRRSQDDIARDLRASIATIGAAFAIRDLANAADQWTNLRNQVRQYADVVGPVDDATSRLVTVANDAGVAVGALGTSFAASARAASTLGASAEQVFAFNEAVAKGAAIANTGAAALDGALTQLGQSIGSPIVQLGEFNSIIEGTPRLAQAFADGVAEAEGSVAKLRQLISSGEISGQELFQGLISQLGTLRKEFAESETTISRSLNRLGNAFVQYVGNADRASGVTQNLSGFIDLIANNFDTLADAAIVAASVLGGTLAAGAIVRLIAGLGKLRTEMATTAGAMGRLQLATAFLTGPLAATVLAIGAALVTMGLSATDAGTATDRVKDSLEKLGKIRDDITTQTGQLQAAQEKLNQALRDGGEAAKLAGAAEVDRIRKLLEGNRALFQLERARAQQALNDKSAAFRTEAVEIKNPDGSVRLKDSLENLDFKFLAPNLRARGQSVESFADDIARIAQSRGLSDQERTLQAIALAILNARTEMADLTEQVKEYDRVLTQTSVIGGDQPLPFPSIEQGSGSGGRGLRGYRTDLEQLTETLKALRQEAASSQKTFSDMTMAFDSLQALTDTNDPQAVDRLESRGKEVQAFYEAFDAAAIERSRVAVQTILDFAAATDDVSVALRQVPSFADVLTPGDLDLVRTKLSDLAQEGLASIATGYAAVEADFQDAIAELEAKRRDAEAAGLNWLGAYLAKREELEREFADRRAAVFDEQMGPITGIPSITDPSYDPVGDISQSMQQSWVKDGLIPTEAQEEFERVMRESVKNAFRDGVRTGDWGDAFKSIFADALTASLDDALNRIAEFLARELFKENGWVSTALNAVFAAFSGGGAFGGARAAGGPVIGGKTYLVGERGPELVTMGASGQVLNADMTRNMLSGGHAAGVNIHTPLTVMGSIDAVTWPKVQEAMRQQARQIMSAVPATVNATLIDNRTQKRRF